MMMMMVYPSSNILSSRDYLFLFANPELNFRKQLNMITTDIILIVGSVTKYFISNILEIAK